MTIFDQIRTATARVAETASHVRIDPEAIARLAPLVDGSPPEPFDEERFVGDVDERVMAILAWNTVNFGSGWFPLLAKLPDRSGARTLATHWQSWCRDHGTPDATWLAGCTRATVAEVFHQDADGPARPLLDAFRGAWREIGTTLVEDHDGSATRLVESAENSAAALVRILGALPHWRDRHRHAGTDVPLFKRAQIMVSTLHTSFEGTGPGAFDDVAELTCFADNLVPHVLKMHGVLVVDDETDARIEAGDRFVIGERAEVELRACGVHAVELLVEELRSAGRAATAADVDHRLWQMGQNPAIKARPRHRCPCTFY